MQLVSDGYLYKEGRGGSLSNTWIGNLENTELDIVRSFLLVSGNIKHLAQEYEVSYPTMRRQLNVIIKKVATPAQEEDSFLQYLLQLVGQDELSAVAVKKIINAYTQRNTNG